MSTTLLPTEALVLERTDMRKLHDHAKSCLKAYDCAIKINIYIGNYYIYNINNKYNNLINYLSE